jgi:hypothetical protein
MRDESTEREATDRAAKAQQIREWREGLAVSHAEYQKWEAATRGRKIIPDHLAVEPNIASRVWFQSLRLHLASSGETNQSRNQIITAANRTSSGTTTQLMCSVKRFPVLNVSG